MKKTKGFSLVELMIVVSIIIIISSIAIPRYNYYRLSRHQIAALAKLRLEMRRYQIAFASGATRWIGYSLYPPAGETTLHPKRISYVVDGVSYSREVVEIYYPSLNGEAYNHPPLTPLPEYKYHSCLVVILSRIINGSVYFTYPFWSPGLVALALSSGESAWMCWKGVANTHTAFIETLFQGFSTAAFAP